MATEDRNDETKQFIGACTGGAAGLIGGGKLGLGIVAATVAIPVVGPFLAGTALIGAPVAGAVLGAKAGKQNPTDGVFGLLMSVFIPGGIGGGDGGPASMPDAPIT
jgi:hypothetical protein